MASSSSQSPTSISDLPENCISHILSLTMPRDVCRASFVSKVFLSAADSDYVWERILPSDYEDILARSVSPIGFHSSKELFRHLSSFPLIIDGGRRSFSIDRSTGKKCFMLSARELHIAWGGNTSYWRWIALPESRFPEVAELLAVCWLEIQGSIAVSELSPNTNYAAYCILKHRSHSNGFDSHPVTLSLFMSNDPHVSRRLTFIHSEDNVMQNHLRGREGGGEWMEIEFGEFYTGEHGGRAEFSLTEVERLHWKSGLVLEGIEIRPR